MADSQEIVPCPEKPSELNNKTVQVTVEEVRSAPSPTHRKPLWRPFAHRTVPLIVLIVVALGLIGALEAAMRVLPSARLRGPGAAGAVHTTSGSSSLPTIAPSASASSNSAALQKRQAAAFTGATTTTATPASSSTTSDETSTGSIAYSPAPSAYQTNGVTSATESMQEMPTMGADAYPPAQATTKTASGAAAVSSAVAGNGPSKPKQPAMISTIPLTLAEKSYNFFLGTYAPVLVAVLLRILVTPLYRCTKLVDPFDQLIEADGAPFRDFYLAHHLGAETMRAPYQAYQRRRWNLFWTASLYATVQSLTPLASELTQIRSSAYPVEVRPHEFSMVFGQAIWIDSVVVRVVQGLLGLICVQLIVVMYRLWKNEPSLPANPASIATMASLFGHPQTSRDFSRIDQRDLRVTMGRFRDRRYRLETYTARDGSERYGLVPKGGKIRAPPPKKIEDDQEAAKPKPSMWSRSVAWVKRGGKRAPGNGKQRSIAWQDVQNLSLVTAGAGSLFGLVLAYFLTSTQTGFELFMDSEQFGPRFILSLLALFLKSPLRCLWLSITAALPWKRLADAKSRAGGASVRDVVEPVPVAITPLGGLPYALRRGEWFAAGLSLAAGLAVEVLIVLLPGVPYSSKQLYMAAKVSWIGSLTCLSAILLVTILGWLRMLLPQGRAAWPRPPVTVGAVATYVAGSSMAVDFAADSDTKLPPATTRFRFQEKEGRWMVDYVLDDPE